MTRRIAFLGAAGLLIVASPATAVRSAPALTIAHSRPLTLAGAHFAAHERVTVTLHTPSVYAKRVVARTDGSFTVAFGTVGSKQCAGLRADAVGATGDRATLRLPRLVCITPPATN